MRNSTLLLLLALLHVAASPAGAQQGVPPVAFVGVNVPSDDGRDYAVDQTVVVRDGVIEVIGPASDVRVPGDAILVDGRSKFLVPGLIDMHIHPTTEAQLRRLALHGVTTGRVMNGRPDLLRLRDRIMSEGLLAPELIVAGPILEGPPPEGYEDVIETGHRTVLGGRQAGMTAVAEQAEAGYDLIKVYNNVDAEAYAGIVEEARRRGLDVTGHVPFPVGLAGTITAGQRTIEHLRGYIWEAVPTGAARQPGPDFRSRLLAWNDVDTLRFPALARATAEAGVWNCPTLVSRTNLLPTRELVSLLASPDGTALTESARLAWLYRFRRQFYANFSEQDLDSIARGLKNEHALVRALAAAGAPLCAGTDLAISGLELSREIELLSATGIGPVAALNAATGSPARALRRPDLGHVTVGARADLLLLDDDPRAELRTLRRPAGISLRGRWLPRAALDSLLALEDAAERSTLRMSEGTIAEEHVLGEGIRPQPVGDAVYFLSPAGPHQRFVEVPRKGQIHRIARLMPLMVHNDGRTQPRRVLEDVLAPQLTRTYDVSRDGRRVAYITVTDAGTAELRLHDLGSGMTRTLSPLENTDPIGPRFSPDGALVAFTNGSELLVVPATGGEPTPVAAMGSWDGLVAWSAGGDRIMALGYPPGSGGNALVVARLDGSPLQRLTRSEHDRFYKEGFAWSPDESRVAYMCYCGNDHLRVAYLDGRPDQTLLDRAESWDWMGAWSPDGSRYLFIGYGNEQGLFALDPSTGEVMRLAAGLEPPEFAPDGRTMVRVAPDQRTAPDQR